MRAYSQQISPARMPIVLTRMLAQLSHVMVDTSVGDSAHNAVPAMGHALFFVHNRNQKKRVSIAMIYRAIEMECPVVALFSSMLYTIQKMRFFMGRFSPKVSGEVMSFIDENELTWFSSGISSRKNGAWIV